MHEVDISIFGLRQFGAEARTSVYRLLVQYLRPRLGKSCWLREGFIHKMAPLPALGKSRAVQHHCTCDGQCLLGGTLPDDLRFVVEGGSLAKNPRRMAIP